MNFDFLRDLELSEYLNDPEEECPECGKPNKTGNFCNENCFSASQL